MLLNPNQVCPLLTWLAPPPPPARFWVAASPQGQWPRPARQSDAAKFRGSLSPTPASSLASTRASWSWAPARTSPGAAAPRKKLGVASASKSCRSGRVLKMEQLPAVFFVGLVALEMTTKGVSTIFEELPKEQGSTWGLRKY